MSVFDQDLLRGKVAIVTGGGSGIGKGIVELFMRHGANVMIIGRNKEKAESSAQELEKLINNGTKCAAFPADVRNYTELESAFTKIMSTFNRIDILVNGAAGNFLAPVKKLSANAFKTVMDIDVNGTYNASKLAFHQFMEKNGGVILNLSATLAYNATLMQTHAGTAKAAVDAMTKHLAVEWGPLGIRVNSIQIGPIKDTEGMKRLTPTDADINERLKEIPLQRMGTIYDIANTCLFLVSDAASYITGAIIAVDGGNKYRRTGITYQHMSKL